MEAWIPFLIIFGLFLFFMRRGGGGMGCCGGGHSHGQSPEQGREKLNDKS